MNYFRRNFSLALIFFIFIPFSAFAQTEADFTVFPTVDGKGVEITGYRGNIKDVRIPPQIQGLPVISIGKRAFLKKSLTSVTIPNSVTSIGHGAFSGTQLTSVTIPNSVTSIGGFAFSDNQLTSVTIPNSVTSIGESAFEWNQLTSVMIPNNVTSIGNGAFSGNELTSVTIPNSVTSIGEGSFFGNQKLTSITVAADNPNYSSVDGVLYNKNRTTLIEWPAGKTPVNIPNSVTTIGNYAFAINQLTSVTIPDSVTSIGNSVFERNQLTSVTIPNSVTSIGNRVFESNQLTSVTIPNSVTSIGERAFYQNQLTSVTIGVNVTLKTGINASFSGGFEDAYNNGGKRAGTYTRPNTDSTTWTRR